MLAQRAGRQRRKERILCAARVEWLAKCLQESGRPSNLTLDYGCGTGDTTLLLREILGSVAVSGLDVSVLSLERARTRHGGHAQFFRFGEYVPDGSIDVVYCNGVFRC